MDSDMYLAARSIMDAVRDVASELGLEEGEAEEQAAGGIMEAAQGMDSKSQMELRPAISSAGEYA